MLAHIKTQIRGMLRAKARPLEQHPRLERPVRSEEGEGVVLEGEGVKAANLELGYTHKQLALLPASLQAELLQQLDLLFQRLFKLILGYYTAACFCYGADAGDAHRRFNAQQGAQSDKISFTSQGHSRIFGRVSMQSRARAGCLTHFYAALQH
eukprot:CAMPEP_0181392928 /NCGR_PEP_ID=MMETSP1106-20121128/26870_1 /TAXON_ID=81844 /ORGANISM="Mantoniella antarctica, Strain SL-175" /LENGTH=152 /DNA_ID=CAMNT_0023514119 /DNA_START=262 /DNA_END=717 /DNA_ORIENTATION=+